MHEQQGADPTARTALTRLHRRSRAGGRSRMSTAEPGSTVATVSIGDVLDQLRPEFADITISKIRFLESQGLIDPERTPSGYRKFSAADIDRLRFILREQREHFLPLKV